MILIKTLKYLILYHFLENKQIIFGHFLRKWLLPPFFKSCGENLQVRPRVHFECIENIELGNSVSFNYNCFINAYGDLKIGNNCLIGPGVTIITANHYFKGYEDIRSLGHNKRPVIIGNNVWIAANVTILPGVIIGDNVIIGAGSVVTRSVPSNKVIAGNPARQIGENDGSRQ